MSENIAENVNTSTGEIVEAQQNNVGQEIVDINHGDAAFYSSIKGDDMDARISVLEAMSNATPLADSLNKALSVANIIIQEVSLTDEVTGKTNTAPRITLIDADGTAYSATSIGIFSSVKQLLAVAGEPENWSKPVAMYAVEAKGSKPGHKYMTLKYGKPSK